MQAAIPQVNAPADASKIDGENMEIRDIVGGSNTPETRQRSGRNRRREKKRKGRREDMAKRKKTSSDKSVEDSGEDPNPGHPAKKKLKKTIDSDSEVGKDRKEGKGYVDKGIKETSNFDVHVYVKGQKLELVLDLFMNHRQNITVDGITYSCGVPK